MGHLRGHSDLAGGPLVGGPSPPGSDTMSKDILPSINLRANKERPSGISALWSVLMFAHIQFLCDRRGRRVRTKSWLVETYHTQPLPLTCAFASLSLSCFNGTRPMMPAHSQHRRHGHVADHTRRRTSPFDRDVLSTRRRRQQGAVAQCVRRGHAWPPQQQRQQQKRKKSSVYALNSSACPVETKWQSWSGTR